MIQNCRVTVIIPTWNRAAPLVRAIRSALSQTVEVAEVLVCDDGSTDRSREAVAALDDPRVRWLAGGHSGLPAVPRNRGVAAASGGWLAFLDSDDEWSPDKLKRQLELSQELGWRAVCSDALRMVPEVGNTGTLLNLTRDRLAFADLLETNQVICSSVLVRGDLVARAGCFPASRRLRACEDYAFWLRIATMTDFAVAPEPLVIYRDDPGQSIRSDQVDPVVQKLAVLDDFLGWGRRGTAGQFLQRASRMQAALRRERARSFLSALTGRVRRVLSGGNIA